MPSGKGDVPLLHKGAIACLNTNDGCNRLTTFNLWFLGKSG